jgi:hypothetical protein
MGFHTASSHAKTDASMRHNAASLPVVWPIAWTFSMAFRGSVANVAHEVMKGQSPLSV